MSTATVLQPKGTSRNAVVPAAVLAHSPEAASGILRRATAPEYIGKWKWGELTVHLYAYKSGKAGTENKHELPPPHDTVLLFGECVLFATGRDGKLVKFGTTEYQKFYNETLGGFDDVGSQDSDTADEETDSDGEAEEEEEEEPAADDDEEAEEEEPVPEEEEEDEPPRRLPKITKATAKRNAKKMPAWYSIPELSTESYTNSVTATVAVRECIKRIIDKRCNFLNAAEKLDLERGIFNVALEEAKRKATRRVWENPEFVAVYKIAAQRSIANLDNTSYIKNDRLIARLRDGEFHPHDVPFMSFSELFPEKWKEMEERAMKREAKMLEVDKSMATDMFKCTRCGKRQCTYYEMQTRSADEPMTQFIRCLNCGKQWRQ